MSEPIKVGDAVMVVRGHACDIGRVFIVKDIVDVWGWSCDRCGAEEDEAFNVERFALEREENFGSLISWLKKISPLSEPETVERDESVPA